jgi:hypothetical protein
MYNQLFKIKPSDEIINKILICLSLENLDDNTEFTIEKLELNNVISKYKLIDEEIKRFYIPCKAKLYLSKYEYKNMITVFRQILKTIHYTINGREKYSNKKKFLIYKLCKIEDKNNEESSILTENSVLNTINNKYIVNFN